MRILLINRGYAGGGGAEAAVRGLVQFFSSSGYQVSVLTLRPFPPFFHKEKNATGLVTPLYELDSLSHRLARRKSKNLFSRVCVFLCDWLNFLGPIKALRLIKKINPDVVHTHNLRGMGMLLPLFIRAGKGNARWVHTAHDIQLVYPSGVALYPILEGLKRQYKKIIPPAISNDRGIWRWIEKRGVEVLRSGYAYAQRIIWGSPDVVISPSEFLKEFYCARGFFKNATCEVIPNIGNAQMCDESSPSRTSILFVGALEESKGIEVFVEALRQGGMKAHADIVGEGSLKGQLEREGLPNVIFHGALSAGEIIGLFNRMLVTVVPSLTYENAPMVILESLRAGVPVIASRIGGIPEYVEEGITGWLVEPGSVQELMVSLQAVVENGVSGDMRRHCVRTAVELGVRARAGQVKALGD